MQGNNNFSHIRGTMSGPLFVCWCFSMLAVTTCTTVDGYSCITAYWDTVSCALNISGNSSNYSLKFNGSLSALNTFLCPLVRMNHSYHCDCKVETMASSHTYDLKLCSDSDCQTLNEAFKPSSHIQLTTPYDVKLQQTPANLNFTWNSGYEEHTYFKEGLTFYFLLEGFQSSGSKEFSHKLYCKEKNTSILRSKLKAYYKYCVRVSSYFDLYGGIRSEWSNPMCWDIQKEVGSPVSLIQVLAPLCVVFVVLLIVLYSPASRMKIKKLSHTPSPAPFFQPLFQEYEGNMQEWFVTQSKHTILYKTDEMLITDAVTVVPKPVKTDLDENLDYQDPPVTLPVTLCQTSYVGLPGMHQASSPVTTVCPAGTSYTQLPCSIWGINAAEIQVSASPPTGSLENDGSDSGCSLESLIVSPDCSLPTSPVVDSSPPFQCNDYCTLNKTAEGMVPVLVTKGSSQNRASNDQQDEDEN